MRSIILLMLTFAIIPSCSHPDNNVAATQNEILGVNNTKDVSVNELVDGWNSAWNLHDSVAIIKFFEPGAVLIHDTMTAVDFKEISDKFIHPNYKIIHNLKTHELKSWQSGDRAGYSGGFKLDIIIDEKLITSSEGFISINWIKSNDGWKATVVHINTNALKI